MLLREATVAEQQSVQCRAVAEEALGTATARISYLERQLDALQTHAESGVYVCVFLFCSSVIRLTFHVAYFAFDFYCDMLC